MKKIFCLMLVFALALFTLASCGDNSDDSGKNNDGTNQTDGNGNEGGDQDGNQTPDGSVVTSYAASYTKDVSMGGSTMTLRGVVLLNLCNDNTADIYVATDGMGGYSNAAYSGTYSYTQDDMFRNVLHLTYNYTVSGSTEEQSATIDATITDFEFSAKMFMVASMSSDELDFYEIDPVTVGDGDGFVGFLSKTGGMGQMYYVYYLEMNDDGTFFVSIMQHAAVMHIVGTERGTYTVEGTTITFTYDVIEEDDIIAAEDYVSTGTDFSENSFSAGFNIGQAVSAASPAFFLRVR